MRIRTKRFVATFAGLVVLGALAHTAISQDKPDQAPAGASDVKVLQEMMKMNAPGEQHALLKRLAGTFDGDVAMKMAADAPEMKSKGRETSEMILDGRFLKTDFTGEMMGNAYKGMQLQGYDNYKKKFISVWVDSMSTGAMTAEGTADAAGKVISFAGEYPDPMQGGKLKQYRQVLTIKDDDHHEFEIFEKGPDGKEYRSLYIKYTRAK
jgi:hypothetical protein